MGNPFTTVPGAPSGSPFNPIIYNTPLTAGTGSVSATTLITAPATGTYRLTVAAAQTALGASCASAGTVAVNLIYTNPAASGFGIVNTNGTAVTWVSGALFNTTWTGAVEINGVSYTISSVGSTTAMTLTATAGVQTGVPYSWSAAATTVSAFATFTPGSNNGVLGNLPLSAGAQSITFRALAGTAIQISTTATAGSSCSPAIASQIVPVVESLGQ